jgi:hypothetical protein
VGLWRDIDKNSIRVYTRTMYDKGVIIEEKDDERETVCSFSNCFS